MEKLYQDYKNVAEFRMVYIREAHAADSNRSVPYAKEKGINQQTKYEDRCVTAQMLIDDKSLTMPFLIDSMDNKTNTDYSAQPDRVFVVDVEGKIVVAADRGPRGFKPGLKSATEWLKSLKGVKAKAVEPKAKPPAAEEKPDKKGEDKDKV